jgi:hypothetical protein
MENHMKNSYFHLKSKNRATDKSYGAKCTEFDNKSNGINPGPQKKQQQIENYILTPDIPPQRLLCYFILSYYLFFF